MFEASFTEGLAQDGEGMYEMTMALWDWGFQPEDIAQPVDLFYGDADDILDPKMPLHLAGRLPTARRTSGRAPVTTGSSTAIAGSTSSPR